MQKLKILPKKKVKEILSLIKKQYDADIGLDYGFLKNEKNRIFIINKDISKLNLEKIRINSLGLYFAEIYNNQIRLSIEGSQIIGPKAKKNILEITDKQVKEWLKGEDLETDSPLEGFLLVKNKQDFLGTTKISNGKALNFVSKSRRVNG